MENSIENEIQKEESTKDTSEKVDPNPPKYTYKPMKRQSTVFSIISEDSGKCMLNLKPKKQLLSHKYKLWLLRIIALVCVFAVIVVYLPRIFLTIKLVKQKVIPTNFTVNNLSQPEQTLSQLNLSNFTIKCPPMYIFVPEDSLCEPQCGKWAGCGQIGFYFEKCLMAVLTLGSIILGILTILSWIFVVKTWRVKHLAIFFCAIQSLLISVLLGVIDIPGYGYFYCLERDIPWKQLSEVNTHIVLYASVLDFAGISLILWLACVFFNISLSVYLPLNKRIASTTFQTTLLVVEIIIAWVLPIIFIMITRFLGLKSGLEILILQPQSAQYKGQRISHLLLILVCILMLTAAISIIYKMQTRKLILSKFTTKTIKLSEIEKRYLAYACVTLIIASIRTVLLVASDFQQTYLERNLREYTACITLNSELLSPDYGYRETVYSYFNLTAPQPMCRPPCAIALDAITIRVGLFATFSVTTVQSLPTLVKRLLKIKSWKQ